MALDFPSSPSNGQTYTSAGVTWVYDGTKWLVQASSGAFLPLNGGQLNPGGLLIGTAGSVPSAGTLTLNANTVAPPAGVAAACLSVLGSDSTASQVQTVAFGGQLSAFAMLQTRGTAAAPTAIQNGDWFGQVYASGWKTGGAFGNGVGFRTIATENWTASANGGQIVFFTTPNGSTSSVNSLVLAGNSATFSGTVTIPANASLWLNGTASGPAGRLLCDGNSVYVSPASGTGMFVVQSNGGINKLTVDNNGNATFSGAVNANAFTLAPPSGDATVTFNASGGGGHTFAVNSVVSPAGEFHIFDVTAGALRIAIQPGGNCFNNTGTWSSFSDSRAKTNIEPYDAGLAAILALKPITYDLDTDDWKGERLVGFRAEEVAKVLPELCGTATTKLKGKDTELQTVSPTGVVFALVNAIRELKAEIDALTRKEK